MRIARGRQQRVEELRLRGRVGRQLVVLEEGFERALRLAAVDAVDGAGVIAGDREQPLDAGKPRLRVVVAGVLGELDHQAVVALGRAAPARTRTCWLSGQLRPSARSKLSLRTQNSALPRFGVGALP